MAIAAAGAVACCLLLAACGQFNLPEPPPTLAPTATATPPPAGGSGAWPEGLTFAGGLSGTITVILPNSGGRNECTGKNSRGAGRWASTLTGAVGTDVVSVVATADGYRGPGDYRDPAAVLQVRTLTGSGVWRSGPGDGVLLGISSDEESGRVDATLTSAADGRSKLKVGGTWTCRT